MDKIRLASVEEIEKIQLGADITPLTSVVAFENQATNNPDFAVLRQEFHIEPMIYAEGTTTRRKVAFIWALEAALRINGTVGAYYFHLGAGDDSREWRENIEHMGAENISKEPEFRFKRLL